MINNRSRLTGHRTVKSRDININTGPTNRNVILQVVKSLPEKYESKVIERGVSDGDLEWSTRLKLPRKWDLTLCHVIDLSRAEGREKSEWGWIVSVDAMLEMFSVLCWKELWTETLSENESTAMLHRCGVFSAAGLFFLFTRRLCLFWWTVPFYYIMEKEKGKEAEVIGVEDVRRWGLGCTLSNLRRTRCCTLKRGILPQTVPVKTPSVEMGPGICQH